MKLLFTPFPALKTERLVLRKLFHSDEKATFEIRSNKEVNKLESIEQCHMIAGSFDYLLKVRTKNISQYRTILAEKISSLPNVASTSTFVSMETIKD